jgi:hypothetical protein
MHHHEFISLAFHVDQLDTKDFPIEIEKILHYASSKNGYFHVMVTTYPTRSFARRPAQHQPDVGNFTVATAYKFSYSNF